MEVGCSRRRAEGSGEMTCLGVLGAKFTGLLMVWVSCWSLVELKYLGPKLSHLALDSMTGVVYVGGENHLYQLDASLNLLTDVITGPKNDSPACFPPPGACFVNRTLTDNYNKVLVVDPQRRNLLSCGSLYQGMCESRGLANISRVLDSPDPKDLQKLAVAANTETASTVAFIAPGPASIMSTVLYVATTYTGTTRESRVYRDQVPAIATRSLHKDKRFSFAVVDNDFLKGRTSALYLKSEVAASYLIHYVHGFSSENFSYFLTVQRDQVNSIKVGKQITKIVQICQEDSYFLSYADIPLRCMKNDVDYNVLEAARVIQPGEELSRELFTDAYPSVGDVLVGVFSRTEADSGLTDSAICIYSMKEIRAKFLENIKLCHQGNSSVSGGGYLRVGPRGNCNQQSGLVINNVEDDHGYLCNTNKLESFSNIVGMCPVVKQPVITYLGLRLTALALTVVNQFTVALVGTEDGRLKKLILTQDGRTREYGEVTIDQGQRLLPDMTFDAKEKNIYVLTETNVTRLPVERCGQFDSCSSCLSDGDPYCGWCSLEKKCVLRGSCPNSDDLSQIRWLHGNTNHCIFITTISPTTASVNTVQELHLTIPQLPQTTSYTCVFLELNWSSPVSFWYFGAICKTPDFKKLGLTLGVKGYRAVTLALNSTETGKLFVTKSFSFYNCSNFHSCTSCTNSSFGCDWCVYNNSCFDENGACNSSLIRGKSSVKPGRHGPQHCPQIDAKTTGEILLPAGVKKTVLLKGYNIPELQPKYKNYNCVIDTGDQQLSTPARRHDDKSLTCDIPALNYAENSGTLEVNISVFWGDNFWLESSTKLIATVYKCDVLAGGECSMCVNLNYTRAYLECFWCQDSCTHASFCKQQASVNCPAPQIEAVWPLSGPIQGGTNITIEGTNLGSKFEDIEKSVTVANVGCIPFRSLYLPSRRIVCQTKWRGQASEGPVIVKLEKSSSQFQTNFQYKSPRIEDIDPKYGPKSGGSRITIKGRDLDTGGHHEAALGTAPCVVIKSQITNTSIECITSKVWHAEAKTPVTVFFDGKEYTLNRFFVYKEDPTITRIAPLESILEGGRILTVTGTEFLSIQQPQMFAYVPTLSGDYYPTEATVCQVMNNNVMKCPTPLLVDSLRNIIRSKRAEQVDPRVLPVKIVQLGFKMDGVLAVRNLSSVPNLDHSLKYFPNPKVYNFTEPNGIKILKGDALIIEGSDLNIATEMSEITVTIGRAPCNVTTLSQAQIVCKLPSNPGHSSADDRSGPPFVKVKINNLEFLVGRVEYDVPESYAFPSEAIAGIAAGGGFLLLVIVLILIIYRRQSTRAERIYRKLQIQLDNLESNVRNECKQAFAELQTDMTDLTGDLVSSGIPFWDFHSYIFKVLFPGMTDHIILHPPIQKNGRFQFSDHGLQLFHQLLGKKLFMTTFIRTLEEQRAFSIRDRANVASLLMIVYLNNMEYATEILKSLLVDLVHKSVEGKHPKLMLRRSESVVEKLLTNWLSICLYKYLRDYAGASLFMLYKAIKLQAEKGPVDAVTGDARYSLSEDTLLREKIEPRFLTLNVESGGEIVQVRILDSDTITQAKEKVLDHIYKNVPFSLRPHVRDLELEWRNGPTGPLLLSDVDVASHNKDGWRRLNTLAFYRVHDGAYMSILHRQQTMKYMNGSLDNSMLSIGSVSPILKKDQESGFKEWHLVKHEDTPFKDGGVKMISEIFLTRLLSTKGTLQKYVDDFFKNMLSTSPYVPPVVKYLFDFLDQQADVHGITDYEVVHTWKCNSLPLRFWVNIIKNPDFVFDIHKPRIVDSCLSVVAQTFMDSCSTSEHRLGKDSPSNKLLFAKDIVNYRKLVEKYFMDIRDQQSLSDQQMNVFLADISRTSPKLFYISSALGELYKYVSKYKNELMEALEQDNQANSLQLSCKLGHVVSCMEGPSGNMAYV